jgi:hypothetical protein
MKANQQEVLKALSSVITSRANLAQKLGQSYGSDRDLYTALGYPANITFDRYKGRYTRQDVAKRVVNAYPDATWSGTPVLQEDKGDDDTPLEKEWRELLARINLYHYMHRTDKIAGIGRYGVLLLGFNDGEDFSKPVKPGRNLQLMYVQPYDENHAEIKQKTTKKTDARYGLPEIYNIIPDTEQSSNRNAGNPGEQKATTMSNSFDCHWSRIIHVADGALTSDVYGTPRMECVYNRLQDLEMLSGGSAEMFWRGAFPGFGFEIDPEATAPSESDMEDEIEDYIHGLSRYMRLQGINIKELSPQVSSPKEAVEVQFQLVSAGTGIPQRILTGSERGELASSQDSNNWNARVMERRESFAEQSILRAVINRLVELKVLSAPGKEGYDIVWPAMSELDEEKASIVKKNITEALAKYAATPGIEGVMTRFHFLTEVMGYEPDIVNEMLEAADKQIEEEDAQAREDQEEFERQKAEEEEMVEETGKKEEEGAA